MLCAVKVLDGQVVVAEGKALLAGDLPDAGVGPLPTLQLPLLSLLQSINLQVIGGSKSKLLSNIVVPRKKWFNKNASSRIRSTKMKSGLILGTGEHTNTQTKVPLKRSLQT